MEASTVDIYHAILVFLYTTRFGFSLVGSIFWEISFRQEKLRACVYHPPSEFLLFFSSFLSHSMPIDGLSITPDFSFSFLSPLAVSSAYKFAICNSQFDGSAYHDCSVNGVFLTVFFHICELAFGHSLYSGNYRIGGVLFFSSPFYLLSHISFLSIVGIISLLLRLTDGRFFRIGFGHPHNLFHF